MSETCGSERTTLTALTAQTAQTAQSATYASGTGVSEPADVGIVSAAAVRSW